MSRSLRPLCSLAPALAGVLALTLVTTSLAPQARADIRQHVLVSRAPDLEMVVADFDQAAREAGFQLYVQIDESRTVAHNGLNLSYRHIDYSLSHQDGRSVTASFFMLTEPSAEAIEALEAFLITNGGYGYGPMFELRGLGSLGWYEWSPQMQSPTQTLEQELADWRETYVESE